MRRVNKFVNSRAGRVLMIVGLLCVLTTPAFADLEGGMEQLQSKVLAISTPLAIIFLIIAAWQKSMGNDALFFASLLGTLIMFAAPQIVEFIRASFGG